MALLASLSPASTPPHLAAVLFADGKVYYTDVDPDEYTWSKLHTRGDKQITSLEILAIMIACSTFADILAHRRVVLYSDNTGAYCLDCAHMALLYALCLQERRAQQ